MWGKIKIRRSDTLFREYLLKLRGEVCQKCGKRGRVEMSHFWGRRHENTRHDPENVDVLCSGCHRFFHENPAEYTAYKLKKMGQKAYDILTIRAQTYCKRDDKMRIIEMKALLNELSTFTS